DPRPAIPSTPHVLWVAVRGRLGRHVGCGPVCEHDHGGGCAAIRAHEYGREHRVDGPSLRPAGRNARRHPAVVPARQRDGQRRRVSVRAVHEALRARMEGLMPDRNLPRWGRGTLRVVGAVSYALVAVAGVVAFTWPPTTAPEGD